MNRDQAIVIGQALCHGKWLECAYYNNPIMSNLNNHHLFYDDNSYYKPGQVFKIYIIFYYVLAVNSHNFTYKNSLGAIFLQM